MCACVHGRQGREGKGCRWLIFFRIGQLFRFDGFRSKCNLPTSTFLSLQEKDTKICQKIDFGMTFLQNFNWKWSEIWLKRTITKFLCALTNQWQKKSLGYKKKHTLDCTYSKRLNHIKPILKLFWNISHISFLKTSENLWFWKWNLSKWNIGLKMVKRREMSGKRKPLKRIFSVAFTLYLENFLQKLTKAKKNYHEL